MFLQEQDRISTSTIGRLQPALLFPDKDGGLMKELDDIVTGLEAKIQQMKETITTVEQQQAVSNLYQRLQKMTATLKRVLQQAHPSMENSLYNLQPSVEQPPITSSPAVDPIIADSAQKPTKRKRTNNNLYTSGDSTQKKQVRAAAATARERIKATLDEE